MNYAFRQTQQSPSWIPEKVYTIVSKSSLTANNGLTKTGSLTQLGGNLVKQTTISGDFGNDLLFTNGGWNNPSTAGDSTSIHQYYDHIYFYADRTNHTEFANVVMDPDGLNYDRNYAHANALNPRWLTDKNYVDSAALTPVTGVIGSNNADLFVDASFALRDSVCTIRLPAAGTYYVFYQFPLHMAGTTSTFQIVHSGIAINGSTSVAVPAQFIPLTNGLLSQDMVILLQDQLFLQQPHRLKLPYCVRFFLP